MGINPAGQDRLPICSLLLHSAIEPVRERALTPLHAHGQVGLWLFQGQVTVAAHEHARMESPAKTRARCKERPLELLARLTYSERRLPVVASVENVTKGPGRLHTR